MNYKFKRNYAIFLFVLLNLIIVEITMFNIVFGKVYAQYIAFEASAYIIILTPIIIIPSNKFTCVYSGLVLLIVDTLFILNTTLCHASNDIFSMQYLILSKEAMTVMDSSFLNINYIFITIGFVVFQAIGVLLIQTLIKKKNNKYKKNFPLFETIGVLIFCFGFIFQIANYFTIQDDNKDNGIFKNKSGYDIVTISTELLKKSSMQKYGLINYTFAEITNIISTKQDFSLDENQDNDSNKYSGLLSNYNVITIMIETGASILINEKLTPNLYKLQNEGINFTNNISKNKTHISENIGITGSTAEVKNASRIYYNNFAMPYMIKDNYQTAYFHANNNIYNRGLRMPAYGFDNTYLIDTIAPERAWSSYDGNYPLDSWFMGEIKNLIVPEKSDQPFFSFWTTLSTHGPYNCGQKNMKTFRDKGFYEAIYEAEQNGEFINPCTNKGYSQEVINQYECLQCEMMDLDEALGILIQRLIETEQYNNTLLVLYGDHDIYYESNGCKPLKEYIYDLTTNQNNPEQYQTILIFSNPKLTSKYRANNEGNNTYNCITSPYVIVPSIFDLLDVKYDCRAYGGHSVFSITNELENLFYSHELGAILTDKAYSNDGGETYEFLANDVSANYLDNFKMYSTELLQKISFLNKMYNNNNFSFD